MPSLNEVNSKCLVMLKVCVEGGGGVYQDGLMSSYNQVPFFFLSAMWSNMSTS